MSVYTCHWKDCEITNRDDESLEDYFFCDLHLESHYKKLEGIEE